MNDRFDNSFCYLLDKLEKHVKKNWQDILLIILSTIILVIQAPIFIVIAVPYSFYKLIKWLMSDCNKEVTKKG